MNTNEFKIIAIKTGKKGMTPASFLKSTTSQVEICYLKNLKPNNVFPFTKGYEFPNNDFDQINLIDQEVPNIYDITLKDGTQIPINVSAVVGENGSGKSSLIELLYWMNYNIGCEVDKLKTWNGEEYEKHIDLDLQIFYKMKNVHYILKFKGGLILQKEINFFENTNNSVEKWMTIRNLREMNFFYTVVLNQSQYALNSLEVGEWINPLFHKNDGYQTPIVINPMRTEGNVDINKERLLLSRRLQANVLEKIEGDPIDSLRNLANNKIAEKFEIKFNPNYFEKLFEKFGYLDGNELTDCYYAIKESFVSELPEKPNILLIRPIVESKYGIGLNREKVNQTIILNYIYYKLLKIVYNYPTYRIYRTDENDSLKWNDPGKRIKNINSLLASIKKSNSHITFKVKGAILHLKYFKDIYPTDWKDYGDEFKMNIDTFSNYIFGNKADKEKGILKVQSIEEKEGYFVNTYMMAMPSFFNIDVIPEERVLINSFSSGEKQKIHSLTTLVYHLINLNSVEEKKETKDFEYVNLVLDEIELYYHPEWQRTYLYDLLEYLKKMDPRNLNNFKGINITFITHSPFILSDIPAQNVLRLEDGKPSDKTFGQTFGANIHQLLHNDFYLENGFIGEFAKSKIEEVVDFLRMKKWESDVKNIQERISLTDNEEDIKDLNIQLEIIKLQKSRVKQVNESLDIDKCREIIDLVGEPVLGESLNQLLADVKNLKQVDK